MGDAVADRAAKVLRQITGRCGKRPCFFRDGDRPLKRLRLNVDGDSVDACFVPLRKTVVFSDDPGFGTLTGHNGFFVDTVAESAGPKPLADWDAFYDALLTEELENNDVDVEMEMGAVARNGPAVRISQQVFVRQVLKKLKLRLYGFRVVLEETGMYRASIEFDSLAVGADGARLREIFFGLDERSQYAAMESASQSALAHLMFDCNVSIKDPNFGRVKFLEDRCAAAEKFNQEFMELMKMKDKQFMRFCLTLSEMMDEAHRVCKQFGDDLPFRFSENHGSRAPGAVKVVYAGMRPPVTALEKIAFTLVSLMDDLSKFVRKISK